MISYKHNPSMKKFTQFTKEALIAFLEIEFPANLVRCQIQTSVKY